MISLRDGSRKIPEPILRTMFALDSRDRKILTVGMVLLVSNMFSVLTHLFSWWA